MTFKSIISRTVGNNAFGFSTMQTSTESTTSGYPFDRTDYHTPFGWASKGHHKTKGGSALNALTLLAFLFFLNILQNCLKDNVTAPQTPIVVMISNDNGTEMNGTKIVRTKREVNDTRSEVTTDNMNMNKNDPLTTVYTPQQYIEMMTGKNYNNDHFDNQWNNEGRKLNNKKSTKENKTKPMKQSTKPPQMFVLNVKATNKKDDINNNINKKTDPVKNIKSSYDDNDYDYETVEENKTPFFENLMWKAMETFKPGIRETVEDSICCKLIACEGSRLSKKLGGYVKYFVNRYVNKGLEWVCQTDEIRRAMKIGRDGKSCADEISECKPRNMLNDVILFLDYVIV